MRFLKWIFEIYFEQAVKLCEICGIICVLTTGSNRFLLFCGFIMKIHENISH